MEAQNGYLGKLTSRTFNMVNTFVKIHSSNNFSEERKEQEKKQNLNTWMH